MILTTSIFDRSFTIKGLIIPSLSLFIVTFLTYIVYVQNLQIIELVSLIKKLQGQIDLINTNFKLLEDQKNTEIQALQESLKVLMKTSSSIDSESIRDETERRALYIKTFLIIVGSYIVLSAGYVVVCKVSSGFSIFPKVYNYIGAKLVVFTHYDTFIKTHKEIVWKVDIANKGSDLNISVKLPGSGTYENALELLPKLLLKSDLANNSILSNALVPTSNQPIDTITSTTLSIVTSPTVQTADFVLGLLPNYGTL